MTLNTLLVPVRDHEALADADQAVQLCKGTDRHLSFVVYGESPPPPVMTFEAAGEAALWAQVMTAARDALEERTLRLRERLAASGVSHDVVMRFDEAYGSERDVGYRARHADATLFVRHGSLTDGVHRHLLSGAIFHSARPVILLPESDKPTLDFRHVVVAWNGDMAAARALGAALPLCRAARSVRLLSVDEAGRHETDEHAESMRSITDWLRRHDIEATIEKRSSCGHPVGDVLRQVVAEVDADLVVAGAYGRSELRERLFGGTTRDMLAGSDVPMLLAH